MTFANGAERDFGDGTPRIARLLIALEERLRPAQGWLAVTCLVILAALPAYALQEHAWLSVSAQHAGLVWSGPLGVGTVWLVMGWGRARRMNLWRWIVLLVLGLVVTSQLVLGWLPGVGALWRAITENAWAAMLMRSLAMWESFFSRASLWWQGFQGGGGGQDNLILTAIGTILIWSVACVAAWLARRTNQGLAAAAPLLWLTGLILLYGGGGRNYLVAALALTICLQIALDQAALVKRWQRLGLDHAPGLLLDRALAALSAATVVLTVAALMPNLYWEALVVRYYDLIAPVVVSVDSVNERLFPDTRGVSRLRSGGVSGMPNDFLLQGGTTPGDAVVMRVRTNEAPIVQFPFEEMSAPLGHAMRGGTLVQYDGRGWSNPRGVLRESWEANTRYGATTVGRQVAEQDVWGRRDLVQNVVMEVASPLLFAAAEPVEFSVPARVELLSGSDEDQSGGRVDDFVMALAREPSYTVISSVPALSESALRRLPAAEIDDHLARYLQLPDTITARTRELADEITTEAPSPYAAASAIEQYLRQYPYDLGVSEPPGHVEDVADYFLFELQRGYCDYYATAFVVLARLAGLPARFATGYAAGAWYFSEGVWVITEADAHSWPEVYFDQVGWVAFEPTAARPLLARIGSPEFSDSVVAVPPVRTPAASPSQTSQPESSWQVWLWLGPTAVVLWAVAMGLQAIMRRREDPWQRLLRWGERSGYPMEAGDTILEYGERLAGRAQSSLGTSESSGENGRVLAREVRGMSQVVNRWVYSPPAQRPAARDAVLRQWRRTGGYLRRMRLRSDGRTS